MKNRYLTPVLLLAFILPVLPPAVRAQYRVLNGTFANGGGVRAGDGYVVYDTAGQPVIGIVSGASNTAKAGFWYCAGISSTVDVAFASFFGKLKDDAVILSWSASASAAFEGFNVYRSEGTEDAFAKLNAELIPKERGCVYTDETALAGTTYVYRIGAVSKEGEWYSQSISFAIPPKPTTLYQNYPNPFNPSTNIALYLASPGRVSLVIYDVRGGVVRTLVDETKPAGRHTALWDGRNDGGRRSASGVYYYRLVAGKSAITRKIVVVR
ncbi:MAG: T9SS type A sorting domain-containing protein [Candidatus Krumholzibacteria bacterium]|nr:T9SS type A sorting domain-containing protein [Candidatus Krumholzibacteria bacterium]